MANEYDTKAAQIKRRRGLYEALTQSAFQQPQGQMVSGHYVAPGVLDTIARPLLALAAGYGQEDLDKQEAENTSARNQGLIQALQSIQAGQAQGKDFGSQALVSDFPELQQVGQKALLQSLLPGQPETFSQPTTVVGPDGRPMLAQFGNRGTQRPIEGVQPYQEPSYGNIKTVTNPDGSLGYVAFDKAGNVKPIEGVEAYVRPPAQTNINNNIPTQETARDKALGQEEGKAINAARQTATIAQRNFNLADRLERLDTDGVLSGPTAKPALFVGQLATGLGIPVSDTLRKQLSSTENYNVAIGTELKDMILNSSAGRGFTDTDRDFVEKSFPNLLLTPEGRKQAISFLKESSVRALDEARATEQAIMSGTTSQVDLTSGKLDQYRQSRQPAPAQSGGIKFLGFE